MDRYIERAAFLLHDVFGVEFEEVAATIKRDAAACRQLAAVMKVFETLADLFRNNGSKLVRAGFVNGLPGFITLEADGDLQTTALDIEDGKVAAIYVVRNPDKLRHLH